MRPGIFFKTVSSFCISFYLSGCSDAELQTMELESCIEEAWDNSEEPAKKRALTIIRSFAENPSPLGKDYTADWNSTFDVFTLKFPIDVAGRTALSAFLGEWGDDFNSIDSFIRQMTDKNAVRRAITKKFNDEWTSLMLALLAVDGTFYYVVETDSWSDNEFEFDTEDMYGILTEKGYFKN